MVESFKPEERMEIAKHAIAPLAAQLQGHGVDVNAFANQFADARYATSGKGNISSQATLRFVQTVLTSHPEMADEMIRARTRNMSPDDQKLVNAAVERSGTSGYKKYAYAESVIAQTRQFSKEERGDILGIVKAGESFPAAVARERKELAAIAREGEAEKPKSADDLYREGERNVRDQVNKVRTEISNLSKYMDPLEQGMYEAHFARQVPAARAIEGYSGAASILGGVLRPMELKWALPKSWGGETGKEMLYKQGEAIVEGAEAMAGAGKEWQEAGAARDKYRAAMSRCKTAVANYERSYGDPAAFVSAAKELDTATKELDKAAKGYVDAAKPMAAYSEKMNHVYEEARSFAMTIGLAVAMAPVAKAVAHPIGHALGKAVHAGTTQATATVLGTDAVEALAGKAIHTAIKEGAAILPTVAKDGVEMGVKAGEESAVHGVAGRIQHVALGQEEHGKQDADRERPIVHQVQ